MATVVFVQDNGFYFIFISKIQLQEFEIFVEMRF